MTDEKNTPFAPIWLAYAVLDDKKTVESVEQFLGMIPNDLHGHLLLVEEYGGRTYTGADRYMPLILLLASIWLYKAHHYHLQCAGVRIEIAPLLFLTPPENFLHAVEIGEAAYKEEVRARMLHLLQQPPHDEPSEE